MGLLSVIQALCSGWLESGDRPSMVVDLLAADVGHLHAARAGRLAIEMFGAGAALRDATSEFRPGELEMLTEGRAR